MKKLVAGIGVGALIVVGAVVRLGSTTEGCRESACCRRPVGAQVGTCLRRNPNTLVAEDWGDLNTMPSSLSIGDGCEPTECVLGDGIRLVDGGRP